VDVANLTAWCSGPRGCALTRDILLLDTVRFVRGRANTVYRASRWWILGVAPVRCSRSDGRMIYGVNEAITGVVLRRLEKSRVV
ncbi:unnamed protein product, partial [Prunus brigantina]